MYSVLALGMHDCDFGKALDVFDSSTHSYRIDSLLIVVCLDNLFLEFFALIANHIPYL